MNESETSAADAPVSEITERFFKAIVAKVPLDRIEELHLFAPLRQGGVETGIAVIAARVVVPVAELPVLTLDLGAGTSDEGAPETDVTATLDVLPGADVEPLPGTDVAPLRGTDVAPLRGTDVEPLRGTDVEPLRGTDGAPLPGADVEPLPGKDLDALPGPDVDELPDAAVDATAGVAEDATPLVDAREQVDAPMDTGDALLPSGESAADDSAGSPYAPEALHEIVEDAILESIEYVAEEPFVVERHTVYTARYRLVQKGPERGKWEASVVDEADAPLITVEMVVRGVQRRAGEASETTRFTAAQIARALRVPLQP